MERRLKTTIAAVLGLDVDAVKDDASPETIAEWDSVKQMDIVLAVEDEFEVRFNDDVIATLASYELIRDELASLGFAVS